MRGPRYPAIAICPDDSFVVVRSEADLEAASPAAIRSGCFARLYLFDSDGARWRVARFEMTDARPRSPFGRLVGVRLTFEAPEQPLISDVVEDLCRLVDGDPDDLYGQFVDPDELKRLFRSAPTAAALVTVASTLGGPA
jgi:hypothetical protein